MIQSIVLAIHETGHLEKVPLTHRELDEIGFALAQQNLQNYYGASGLKKISEKHQALSPREKTKIFFEDSNAKATLNDFTTYRDRSQECIIYPPNQNVLYSHPVWFIKDELELAPDSPLFPGGEKKSIIISTFRQNGLTWTRTPTSHKMEQTDRSLNVTYWGDVMMEGEQYQAWGWLRYEFRKNGDLLVFKMNLDNSERDSYGYCWKKK